jgi:hypothetical protein
VSAVTTTSTRLWLAMASGYCSCCAGRQPGVSRAVSLLQRGIRETLPGHRRCAVGCVGEKRRLQSGGCCSAHVLRGAGGLAIPAGLHIRRRAPDLPGPAADAFRVPGRAARCIQPAMSDEAQSPVSPRSARRHCLARAYGLRPAAGRRVPGAGIAPRVPGAAAFPAGIEATADGRRAGVALPARREGVQSDDRVSCQPGVVPGAGGRRTRTARRWSLPPRSQEEPVIGRTLIRSGDASGRHYPEQSNCQDAAEGTWLVNDEITGLGGGQ